MSPNQIDPPLRAAVYARQSKGRKISIKDQLALGRERIQAEEWQEAGYFRDAVSASRYATRERDDWPRLVTLMEASQLDVIWLVETSRGGRIAHEFLRVVHTCGRLNVKVYVEEDERLYDPNDDQDWETLAGQSVRDQAESAKTSRRVHRSKRRARADGRLRRVVGHRPPVGFRSGPDDWVTDPAHAAMLREVARRVMPPFEEDLIDAFEAATEAGPLYRNLPDGSRGDVITLKMVRLALRNPVTAGLLTAPPVLDEDNRWVRRGEVIRQVVDDPPLDRDTWDELQRFYGERSRGRRPKADVYPLGKVLKCGACGNQLTGSLGYRKIADGTTKITANYTCNNRHKIPGTDPPAFREPCRSVTIPSEEVNTALRVAVADWWEAHAEAFSAAGQDGQMTAERAALVATRERLEHQSEVFARKWLDNEWDTERYERMDADVKNALARVRDDLTELDATAEAAAEQPGMPAEIENWDQLSPAEQQRWVRKAFVTPIKVIKAYGTGRKLATDERLILIPRDLS